jgi:hypothetical protein
VIILSLIAGYYQYKKMKALSKAINRSKQRPYYLMVVMDQPLNQNFFLKSQGVMWFVWVRGK